MENFLHGPQGSVLWGKYCYVEFIPIILRCSPVFSTATWPHSTHSTLTRPFKILTPSSLCSLSATLPHQLHTYHINHRHIMPRLSQNHLGTFRAVTERHRKYHRYIRCLYHLDHASTLKEVSVLCLLFQSLSLLHTSPFSCSIKRTRYLVNIPQFVINIDPSEYYPSAWFLISLFPSPL